LREGDEGKGLVGVRHLLRASAIHLQLRKSKKNPTKALDRETASWGFAIDGREVGVGPPTAETDEGGNMGG